jgi:hypothetical protein
MKISYPVKVVVAAVLIWLLPFVISSLFYDRDGTLQTSFVLFKITMAVILTIVSYSAFRWAYQGRTNVTSLQAILVGLIAMVVSVVLDAFTVLPLSGMGVGAYAVQIGLVYLLMIVMSVVASKRSTVEVVKGIE